MTRPVPKLWVVTVHPGGYRTNVTAWIGTDEFEKVCAVLRSKLADGQTLDSTDADAEHARLVVARERWDAAYQAWYAGGAPTGSHPGGLNDYLP